MSTAIYRAREDVHRETVENPDGTLTELTYFEPTEETMRALVEILFQEHWSEITIGPCIEGQQLSLAIRIYDLIAAVLI